MQKYEAHPLAAIFPMMADDELAELAEDIKSNGQQFPIVLGKHDGAEVIVDGRNRYAACQLAGVAPKFTHLNGEDPSAFVIAANIHRRHLSAGQRAMAVAIIHPVGEQGRGKNAEARKAAEAAGFSARRLAQARAVLHYSRPLADAVIAKSISLDEALAKVKEGENVVDSRETRLRLLRKARPDLADEVDQKEMTLEAGEAKARADAEQLKARRWAASKNLIDVVQVLDRDLAQAQSFADDFDPSIAAQSGQEITVARINQAAAFLTAVGEAFSRREESK